VLAGLTLLLFARWPPLAIVLFTVAASTLRMLIG